MISGLVGLVMNDDNSITVDPLIPAKEWDWFCLDNVSYKDKILTIMWDKTGEKYNREKGFSIWLDGKRIYYNRKIKKTTIKL